MRVTMWLEQGRPCGRGHRQIATRTDLCTLTAVVEAIEGDPKVLQIKRGNPDLASERLVRPSGAGLKTWVFWTSRLERWGSRV